MTTNELVRLQPWEEQLTRLGFVAECYDQSGSTMELARVLAKSLAPHQAGIVLSREQSFGRGRHGREWIKPDSGFYATYIFSASMPAERLAGLSLAIGVTLAETVTSYGAEILLKWPNDVLSVSGDKLAGILVETLSDGSLTTALVGIGVNLAGEPKMVTEATSLRTLTGDEIEPLAFARKLSPLLLRSWNTFEQQGFKEFRDKFLARTCYLGAPITMNHDGVQEVGIFRGVDDHGACLVEMNGNICTRASGEVRNLRGVDANSK